MPGNPCAWKLMPEVPAAGVTGKVSDWTKRLLTTLSKLSAIPVDWSPEQVLELPAVVQVSLARALSPRIANEMTHTCNASNDNGRHTQNTERPTRFLPEFPNTTANPPIKKLEP